MGVHRQRGKQWRLRIVLRPGLRLSWVFDHKGHALDLEASHRAIRQAGRNDLIDFIADNRDKIGVLHKKIGELGIAHLRVSDLLPPPVGITVGELADEFLGYIERTTSKSRYQSNFSPSTVSKYRRNLSRFLEWLPEKRSTPAHSVSESTLRAFHEHLVLSKSGKRSVSPIGADRAVTPIQTMFTWASDAGRRSKGAVEGLRPLRFTKAKNPYGAVKALAPEELESICQHCTEEVSALVRTTAELGLRISETLFLRVADVDLEAGFVSIRPYHDRRLKSATSTRDLPISSTLRPILKAAVAAAGSREHLWSPEWRTKGPSESADAWRAGYHRLATQWENACKRAGVKATLHSLRHTYGARLADAGVPPRDIASMLGHSSVATTERYWRTRLDRERKREVLRLLEEKERAPTVPPLETTSGRRKSQSARERERRDGKTRHLRAS